MRAARQQVAIRGPPDRPLPDRVVQAHQPRRHPRSGPPGHGHNVTLVGDLTLHGVTKSVKIPAQAQLVNGTISVAGSLAFPLADFDITAPNVGGFILSIADTGTLEFSASFTKG